MIPDSNHATALPPGPPRPAIAIIGAGMAGLACARALASRGCAVTIFDKGRKPGGRVATRRDQGFAFDHGAQYFTIDSGDTPPPIAGAIAPWDGTIVSLSHGNREPIGDDRRLWVGIPGMSALPRHLSTGLDIRCGRAIARVTHAGNVWRLIATDGSVAGEADRVAVAVPAPQAVSLLESSPVLASRAAATTMAPCWAVMLGFETPLALPFDGAFVDGSPLAWISRDRSKPGRDGGEAWVLHASPRWSRDHLEAQRDSVLERLCHAFRSATGLAVPQPAYAAAHRWRYARVEQPLGEDCLFDAELNIGACGDWCVGGKIGAAMTSGRALAGRIGHGVGSD